MDSDERFDAIFPFQGEIPDGSAFRFAERPSASVGLSTCVRTGAGAAEVPAEIPIQVHAPTAPSRQPAIRAHLWTEVLSPHSILKRIDRLLSCSIGCWQEKGMTFEY